MILRVYMALWGRCILNVRDVIDFEPCFKVCNLVSVYPKNIKLFQMTPHSQNGLLTKINNVLKTRNVEVNYHDDSSPRRERPIFFLELYDDEGFLFSFTKNESYLSFSVLGHGGLKHNASEPVHRTEQNVIH